MKRFGTLAASAVLLVMALACGKKSDLPEPEPTSLFKPAMSYWSLDKAKHELRFNSFDTIEDRQPLVSDRRPLFHLLVIKVPNFKDNGFTGDLVLWFYNDRLMKTQFYVPKMKDYLNVAASTQQAYVGGDNSGGIAPHTHVWIGKEQDGREYLGMEDEILKKQMNDWINRYSAG
jgi:hypothetical protein